MNPEWQHTPDLEFLRSIEYTNRWLQWAKTKDAAERQPRHVPTPLPLPWDPKPKVDDEKPTAVSIAEMNAFLGWSPKP